MSRRVLFTFFIALVAGCSTGLQLRDLGNSHAGGDTYLHFARLESPRARQPLLFLQGASLPGGVWETRPDGQPGWQNFFLRAGHDVYIARAGGQGQVTAPAAYEALAQKVCPCVIVAHGDDARLAMSAAQSAPDRIKAVIAIEPTGAPDPNRFDLPKLRATPHLFVWGDADQGAGRKASTVNRYRDGLIAAGGRAEELDLPKAGIRGNTQLPMTDRNSDEAAARIQRWLEEKELAR